MPRSYREIVRLSCEHCGKPMMAEAWKIVDTGERPDLLARAQKAKLNRVVCPHCKKETLIETITLFFYRGRTIPLLASFVETEAGKPEEIWQEFIPLLQRLEQKLGKRWRDEWVEDMITLSKQDEALFLVDRLDQLPADYTEAWKEDFLDSLDFTIDYCDILQAKYAKRVVWEDSALFPIYVEFFWRTVLEEDAPKRGSTEDMILHYAASLTNEEAVACLEEHPEMLTPEAEDYLDELIDLGIYANASYIAHSTWKYQKALHIARTQDLEAAMYYLNLRDERTEDLLSLYMEYGREKTLEGKAQILKVYPELFSKEAEWLFKEMTAEAYRIEDSNIEAWATHHLELIQLCREMEIEKAVATHEDNHNALVDVLFTFLQAEWAEKPAYLQMHPELYSAKALELTNQLIGLVMEDDNNVVPDDVLLYLSEILEMAHYTGLEETLARYFEDDDEEEEEEEAE